MKLIGSLTSPYVRKVRIVLAEKKIECELVIDSPWTSDSEVPNYNPLGKIPVLVLDDSTTLFDSAVIVEYIDSVAPNNKLMPESNRGRAEAKRWGAVSGPVAEAMAKGALLRSSAELAVAVTGIAGPGGGTPDKPVGLVWFAWGRRGHAVRSGSRVFAGDRAAVRQAAVLWGLDGLLQNELARALA